MRNTILCLNLFIIVLIGPIIVKAQPDGGAPRLTTEMLRGLELRNISNGFRPGRIADITVDPRNRSTWYVATASSGLWKTTNRGTTWTPIFDKGGSYSTGVVVVDPKDSQVIWLGTGENQSLRSVSFGDGVYKSTDAGVNWTKVGLAKPEHIGKIVIDPRDSNVVYVAAQGPLWAPGGDRGLYKTTDGGQTWNQIIFISENTGISDIVFDPRNPDIIFASAYQRRRHVGVLVGGGPEAGILRSEDAGKTWKRVTQGLPEGYKGRIALAVSPQNPDVMYAWMNSQPNNDMAFYRSADAGLTWVRTAQVRIQDPQFYGEIYADPHKFDRVYVMDTRVQVTEDGGQTFRSLSWNTHVDHHALTFDPTDENHLLLGNDGGVYETHDNGQTWRHFTNLASPQFYGAAVSNELPFYFIYGGAQDNGTQGTPSRTVNSDGIRTSEWINVGGGDGMQPRVDPEDGNIVYNQSQNGALQRLDKRTGASTGIRPSGNIAQGVRWNWNTPLIISPHAPQRLYFGGSKLFRSDERGANWQLISPDLTRQIDRNTIPVMGRVWGADEDVVSRNTFTTAHGVCSALSESPLVEGLLYFGSDDHLVQVSEDGGQNWRKIDSFPGVPQQAMVSDLFASAHDANAVYASFNNYLYGDFKPYLLRSGDRGRTWETAAGNLPDRHFVWSVVEDSVNKNLLFAGTEFGLFVTIDGGKYWAKFGVESGVPAATAIRDLEIQKRENDLVAATFGRGFYILDDYAALRGLSPETLAEEAIVLPISEAWQFSELGYTRAVYGNSSSANPPLGAAITYYVKSDMPAGTQLVLAVNDPSGREVNRTNARGTAGIHRAAWNLRGPAAGGAGRGGRGTPTEMFQEHQEDEQDHEEEDEEEGFLPGEQQPGGESQEAQQQEGQEEGEAQEGQPDRGRGGARQGRGGRGGRGAGGAGRGAGGRGGRGGRGGGGGPPVQPGTYSVTLNKLIDGQLTPLGKPQEFKVISLPGSNLGTGRVVTQ